MSVYYFVVIFFLIKRNSIWTKRENIKKMKKTNGNVWWIRICVLCAEIKRKELVCQVDNKFDISIVVFISLFKRRSSCLNSLRWCFAISVCVRVRFAQVSAGDMYTPNRTAAICDSLIAQLYTHTSINNQMETREERKKNKKYGKTSDGTENKTKYKPVAAWIIHSMIACNLSRLTAAHIRD